MADDLFNDAPMLSPQAMAERDERTRRTQAAAIQARPPGPPVPGMPAPPPQHIEDPTAAAENPQVTQADAASSARLARPAGPPIPSVVPRNSFTAPNGMRISEVTTPGQPQGLPATNPNDPLSVLGSQAEFIKKLVGPAPQAPQVNYMIERGTDDINANGRIHRGTGGDRLVVDPTAALASENWRQADRGHGQDQAELFNRLGTMGAQAISAQNAATQRLGTVNAGRTDQLAADSAGRNQYAALLQQRMASHPGESPAEWHKFASGASGMPTARYQQLTSAAPLHPDLIPGSVSRAPAGAATVNANGPVTPPINPDVNANGLSTVRSGPADKPWADIEKQLNEASGRVSPSATAAEVRPSVTPGEFVNRLENMHPRTLEAHWPAIRNYISTTFPGGEHSLVDLEHQDFLPALGRSFGEFMRQPFSGDSEDALGRSIVGNLNVAIRDAGGHAAFLRQQRARAAANGPTPGAPPLP